MSRKSICNLNFHTSVGGTQYTLATILPILARHYDLRVVDPYGNDDFKKLMASNGLVVEKVVALGSRNYVSQNTGIRKFVEVVARSPRYFFAAMGLRDFLKQEHIDLVYVNQTKPAVLAAALFSTRVPIVFHCHAIAATGLKLASAFQSRFARVIANSPYTAQQLVDIGFSKDRIRVVTNTVPIQAILAEASKEPLSGLPNASSSPVILLAHAGIEPNKGTLLTISNFSRLVADGFPGELWITGEEPVSHKDYVTRVKMAIDENHLQRRVHLLGRREDIYAVMNRSDLIVVPSLVNESFGRVAAEAMVLEKPVIVSDRGALPDLVTDRVNGLVFDPNSAYALYHALVELVRSPDLARQYAQRGKVWANREFSLGRFEAQLLKVFHEII